MLVATLARPTPVISERQLLEYRALRVDRELSIDVQVETGDSALFGVWSPGLQCYGLACKRPVRVMGRGGAVEATDLFVLVPWKWWRDDDTSVPLVPSGSAMGAYARRCDGFRRGEEIHSESNVAQEQRERAAVAGEVDRAVAGLELARSRIARHADALGVGIASAR